MPITRHHSGRWLYQFDRVIAGGRQRANRLLPKGWTRAQAQAFDQRETARLYEAATGGDRPEPLIEEAVLLYLQHHAPTLNRLLPNPSAYSPSLPANVAGEPHIQGQQARHHTPMVLRIDQNDDGNTHAPDPLQQTEDGCGAAQTCALARANLRRPLALFRSVVFLGTFLVFVGSFASGSVWTGGGTAGIES